MIEAIEGALAGWLGDAGLIGASSWLHALTWLAALAVAIFAWVAIRRQSLQSRATLLMTTYADWEKLAPQRTAFAAFSRTVREAVETEHHRKKEREQEHELREAFRKSLGALRAENSKTFHEFIAYITFFEVIGAFVRRGYLPFRDVRLLYEGPVLQLEVAATGLIADWSRENHVAPGLLGNAVFLMRAMRTRKDSPVAFFFTYQALRLRS